jgi:hypothetical protein
MTDKIIRCNLQTEHKTDLDGDGLIAFAKDLLGASGLPLFALLENYAAISFLPLDSLDKLPAGWETSFAGRIFNAMAEVRWVADGPRIQAWSIRDTDAEEGMYEKIQRPYYLYGTWGKGRFFETSVQRAKLDYPVQGVPDEKDRARMDVALYRPARPNPWPGDPAAIREQLNRPAVAAHRFVTLAFGRDK